jgi:Tfp pilus assembly protein PilZ
MAYHLRKRRKTPRAPLSRPVQFELEGTKHMGKGVEVGVGGMSVWADKIPSKGKMITVNFSLPGSPRRIIAMAEIAWSKPAVKGKRMGRMGVRFVALPREERDEIRSFVTRLAKHYRDLHILLAMNEWKMERLRELAKRANLTSYRDVKELKERVTKAMDGFRS